MIDTHAHLMFEQFSEDLEVVVERAWAVGVSKIINVGCGMESSRQAVEMAGRFSGVYATLGFHPYDADDLSEELMEEWRRIALSNEKVVAIGECGLDYVKAEASREVQVKCFRRQLELARELNLPVIVHNRDADEDCLKILKSVSEVRAVFHCFGSNLEFAERVWAAGYLTSFTGIITYPNAAELREVVAAMPLDRFMVETDCPYLAPQAYRGERNEPAYVVEVVKKIAELKGIGVEEVEDLSVRNTERFFSKLG